MLLISSQYSSHWITCFLFGLAVCTSAATAFAQTRLITGPIQDERRGRMTGHLHPMAKAEIDLGPMDTAETLVAVTLALRQTPEQQADLDKLLIAQQDPSSKDYHRWLTPQEYADRFGAAQEDIDKITAWLAQQNLRVAAIAQARTWISFTGTAGDVEQAFRTEIHRYRLNSVTNFANATEPSIPVALETAIRSIRGLNDFRMKPRAVRRQGVDITALSPKYTSSSGNHYLSPDDLATIYNIRSLWNAGYDGTGQRIVVPGQTRIDLADIQRFRTRFQTPASDPDLILVPNTRDPGISSDDLGEANLDLEWAGATAPKATLVYVYSYNVMDAVQYAIDQNLAPVISLSYGLCEPLMLRSDALTLQSWARQANVQGITWINASGDSGGADCVYGGATNNGGLAVDIPASIPEVTGIGGTTFNEGSGQYWNATNTSAGGSALSYIPETVWNDSTQRDPAAGGGGASALFAKPSWQAGPGVPDNTARNVPDISLAASAEHDGYLVYSEGQLVVYGGTSAGAPAFAGIAALLNQYLVSSGAQSAPGLGNMNSRLYALAQAGAGVFHDVTTGNNIVTVTCTPRSRNCVSGSFGYTAGQGYDQASGLGSVDAFNLVMAWRVGAGAITRNNTSIAVVASPTSLAVTASVTITATVNGANSVTPLGAVTFLAGTKQLGVASLSGSGGLSTASLTVSGTQLQVGSNSITAQYAGDTTYNGASASTTILVTAGTGTPAITGLANAASFRQQYAPGMVLTIFGSNLADSTLSASSVPLPAQMSDASVAIGGLTAPLNYISPGQLNVQIPYEIPVNQLANLVVNNNGRTATTTFTISPAAPGLFTDGNGVVVPTNVAARSQTISLFLTGAGEVSPAISTGAAPAAGTPVSQLPAPVQGAAVSIGGIDAPIQFIGTPAGLVGVTQVNVRVGVTTPVGTQPVVVTVGGVSSAPGLLTVTAQ